MKKFWFFESIIAAVFAPVERTYQNIKMQSDGKEDFDVQQSIDYCKRISRLVPKYVMMNHRLNQLAEYFDIEMNRRRAKRAVEKHIHVVSSKHVFLISPDRSPEEPSVFSKVFDKYMPPDQRLVYIELDKSEKNSLLSVFHEMGHFIGVRKRYDRLHSFFKPLLINTLCNQLCLRMCFIYNGYRYRDEQIDFTTNCSLPEHSRAFAKLAYEFLDDVAISYLYDQFCQAYDQTLHIFQKDMVDIAYDNGPVDELWQREIAAMEMAFFENIRPIILIVLNRLLSSQEIKQTLMSEASKFASQHVFPGKMEPATDRFSELFSLAWDEMQMKIPKDKKDVKSIPDWYTSCEAQLEEPAADVFMLRVTQTPIAEYIQHIVQLYQTRHQLSGGMNLISVFTNQALSTRVMGICMAAKAKDRDFCSRSDIIDRLFPQHSYRRQRYEVRQLLRRQYRNIHSCPSHCFREIATYIEQLWNDPLYVEFVDQHRDWINKMRKEVNGRCIIRSVLVDETKIYEPLSK